MPPEMVHSITSFCDPRTQAQCARVSKQWSTSIGWDTLEQLYGACKTGNIELVKQLLRKPNLDPSRDENAALRVASKKGHTDVIELLLRDPRFDPSARDNEAIRVASAEGHIDAVQILMSDKRVNPAAHQNEALRRATNASNYVLVDLLLGDDRVDPNIPLRSAIFNGDINMVEIVLDEEWVADRIDFDDAIGFADNMDEFEIKHILVEFQRWL